MSHVLHTQQQLDAMKNSLLTMGVAVDSLLSTAIRAFLDRDDAQAARVISEDDRIDGMDNELDEACLQLLARIQPVAVDLRYVVAAMRITAELERVADEAVNVAEHTLALCELPYTAPHPIMREFSEHTLAMFRKALESFRLHDPALAQEVCAMEEKADDLHAQAVETCFTSLEEQGSRIPVFRIFISRAFERICDLSTNIAELTVFASEGTVIKHQWQMQESRK